MAGKQNSSIREMLRKEVVISVAILIQNKQLKIEEAMLPNYSQVFLNSIFSNFLLHIHLISF